MGVNVLDLWLPIVLSAVAVFIVSSIIHMVLQYHNKDWKKVPDEDAFLEAVRNLNLEAGQYMFPFCDMKDMKDEEKMKRYRAGPHGSMIRWSGAPNMGKNLVYTFVY
ncbi:MAG: hypothetical protein ACYS5V_14125, partial [Planctomycetota bacterium]